VLRAMLDAIDYDSVERSRAALGRGEHDQRRSAGPG
jgi:hypothetical protein